MANKKNPRPLKAQARRKLALGQAHPQKVSPPLNTILPAELHLLIHSFLDPVTSACFGVTCKAFYDIFRKSPNFRVPLAMSVQEGGPALLKGLLYSWVPADQRYFNCFTQKYMGLEGQQEMIFDLVVMGSAAQAIQRFFP